ncbi:MAG: cation-translocating P-type ATPase, partial [Elusimicrobia bacterium]|nr:cation-translocating P-type ATPase [Elusimicrobiota bacterium]
GAATVLWTDKTGTGTLNQRRVSRLWAEGESCDPNGDPTRAAAGRFPALVEYGVLACKASPFDPMEKAFHQLADAAASGRRTGWTLVREYPLSPGLLAVTQVWRRPEGGELLAAAKGAPEAIAGLCRMSEQRKSALSSAVAAMADDGLRVIGVARARCSDREAPEEQSGFAFEFLGLVGLADPVRPAVPASIRECYAAGIRVIMITGDYPGTARNIARQIGLRNPELVITGPELDAMGDEEFAGRISGVNVFARVVPEQKLRIVKALKANREVVAMTGDGVNDAPALKAAHIGIAMGGRGTDVARESAALILLDDDFSSIVAAVRMGRRIFDNIKKAVAFIFAAHVPIAGLSMLPVFFKDWPLILLPVHVVFLELIIDPSCSIIFEAESAERDVMRRPPRDPHERLFSLRAIALSLFQGACVLAILLGVFAASGVLGHPQEDSRRALVFTTMVVANLCLILTNRSWTRTILSMFREPNGALWWVVGGSAAAMGLILGLPGLRRLFHFGSLHPADLVLCSAAGIISILWFESLKMIRHRRRTAPG